jgi:hypothetical protein
MAMRQSPALRQDARMTLGSMKAELLLVDDETWRRTRRRLEGLDDDELRWTPVEPCWTVRPLPDGTWITDDAVPPPPMPPFTTIAWRLVHLIGCYGSERNGRWLGVEVDLPPIESSVRPAPHTAEEGLALLDRAHDRWGTILDHLTDESLATAIGPIGGQYADASRAGFVLHMLDEAIHHGAELGLLRDLYRTQHEPAHADPAVVALLRGGDAFDAVADRAGLVTTLAALGRMDLVAAAIDRGLPPDGPAPTALHRAAGLGLEAVVEQLLAAGADVTATDPDYHLTPAGWAAYFRQRDLARRLRAAEGEAASERGA